MIIISDYTGTKQYAENDDEFTDSLFTPGGSLNLFYKITKRKNHTLYWINEKRGYVQQHDNKLWGQFSKHDNGLFFQYTTAKITRQ